MDGISLKVLQHRSITAQGRLAAFLMHEQMRVLLVTGDVQPSQFPPNPQPGLIEMHRFRLLQLLPHGALQRRSQFVPLFQRRFHRFAIQLIPVQIRKQAADLLQRHLVVDREFGHQRPYPRPVLHCAGHIRRIFPALRLP